MPRPAFPAGVNLPALVSSKFSQARTTGDLNYFPTQVTILPVRIPNSPKTIPFQLRFSPALANKPKAPAPASTPADKPKKSFDPFETPPPGLFLTNLGPSHFLVLNKFAVVPEHFILATKDFKPQTHVLEQDDLEATLTCLEEYEAKSGGSLYAFFNGGQHSGASQPHRHLQLLPVSMMRDGLSADAEWTVLAETLGFVTPPFVTFSEPLSSGISAEELHAKYLRLYQRACKAVAAYTGTPLDSFPSSEGAALISYNMAMTKNSLVICPRLADGAGIKASDGSVVGSLSLNGTVLAGTALVKSEGEWEALKSNPDALREVLNGIGIPSEGYEESKEKI